MRAPVILLALALAGCTAAGAPAPTASAPTTSVPVSATAPATTRTPAAPSDAPVQVTEAGLRELLARGLRRPAEQVTRPAAESAGLRAAAQRIPGVDAVKVEPAACRTPALAFVTTVLVPGGVVALAGGVDSRRRLQIDLYATSDAAAAERTRRVAVDLAARCPAVTVGVQDGGQRMALATVTPQRAPAGASVFLLTQGSGGAAHTELMGVLPVGRVLVLVRTPHRDAVAEVGAMLTRLEPVVRAGVR